MSLHQWTPTRFAPDRFVPNRFALDRSAPAQSKCLGGSQIKNIVVAVAGMVSEVVLALLEQETRTTDNSTPMSMKFVLRAITYKLTHHNKPVFSQLL